METTKMLIEMMAWMGLLISFLGVGFIIAAIRREFGNKSRRKR